LFSTDQVKLSKVLKNVKGNYKDKAVQSIRSITTNLNDFLDMNGDAGFFMNDLFSFLARENSIFMMENSDIQDIEELSRKKYHSWEWNFGYSPSYTFLYGIDEDDIKVEATLTVEKGIITNIKISGEESIQKYIPFFCGIPHREDEIVKKINDLVDSESAREKLKKMLAL
ncbi:MAG: hypothetical protein ACOCWG_03040, partial [bacterium]